MVRFSDAFCSLELDCFSGLGSADSLLLCLQRAEAEYHEQQSNLLQILERVFGLVQGISVLSYT